MTVKKAKGQTLQMAVLHQKNQFLSHGRILYVAYSSVFSSKHLYKFDPENKAVNTFK